MAAMATIVVLRRVAAVVVPALGLVALSFAAPRVPLDGMLADAAYVVAESGDTLGVTLVAVLLIAVLVTRPGLTLVRRVREAVVFGIAAGLILGGGAWLNEHGIKPWFAVARPSILELESHGTLQLDAVEFYGLGDKRARSAFLTQRLAAADYAGPRLGSWIRDHWSHMTGYSFPSGHSFASMLALTFFLSVGLALAGGWRRWPFFALAPWAVLVCWSRVVLRVHSPLDVTVGALQGILVGALAFVLVAAVLGPSPTVETADAGRR